MRGISWANFILGVWLFFSPFALRFSETKSALYEHLILGFLIIAFALWRAIEMSEKSALAGASWTVAVLGVLALIAPFVLGYSAIAAAAWNDVIIGVAVTALAVYNAFQEPHALPMHREQH
jgi:SPW repeat